MRLRISIASAALAVVAACTAFEDVPEPKQPRTESNQTEAADAAALGDAAPLQGEDHSDAASDAVVEAAARVCGESSSESFCVGDVLHQCTSAGETIINCGPLRTHCVSIRADSASCQ